jgi:LemA protein
MGTSKISEKTYLKRLVSFILGIFIGWLFFIFIFAMFESEPFTDSSGEMTDFSSMLALLTSLLVMVLYGILSEYNYLKKLELTCESLLSNITVYKKRETTLLKKAWKIISNFLGHEGDIQKTVAQTRTGTTDSSDDKKWGKKFNNLKLVVENYPELKSDKHIMKILKQVEESQNIILNGKLDHNRYVTYYNTAIVSFPAMLFIGLWKLKKLDLYVDDVGEEDEDFDDLI